MPYANDMECISGRIRTALLRLHAMILNRRRTFRLLRELHRFRDDVGLQRR